MKSHPPKSEPGPEGGGSHGPTDFHSLMGSTHSPAARQKPKAPQPTDFQSLKEGAAMGPKRVHLRSQTDLLIDFFTPLMILIMVASVVYFLLDVRYVYTEVHSLNLRVFATLLIVGVVGLNRLIAREGSEESFVYIAMLAGVVVLYTLTTTTAYDVGSVAREFLNRPGVALGFNMAVVGFIWWLTNRLMHECCVDENLLAGDIGILSGTARRVLKQTRRAAPAKKSRGHSFDAFVELDAVDPLEWKKSDKLKTQRPEAATKRLQKRHPGVSIFYFSIPAILLFAIAPRIVQHGGQWLIMSGYVYLGFFAFAALTLLMLTSLAGVRAYFRRRHVRIPSGIGAFWLGLGLAFVIVVLVGAAALPRPNWPELLYIDKHQYDPWNKGSTFQLAFVTATPVEVFEQSRILERVGVGVLIFLGLFLGYGCLRGAGAVAFAIARRRDRFPAFVVRFFDRLDRLLVRLARWPSLPKRARRYRVSRTVAQCVRYESPLASGAVQSGHMSPRQAVETSYNALCALAADLGVPRRDDQTPYEFIEAFPEPLKTLREDATELTDLYVRASYSPEVFDVSTAERLRKFWFHFERVRARVVR